MDDEIADDDRGDNSPDPTPESYAAAERLLAAQPFLIEGRDRRAILVEYAQLHARAGDDLFPLLVGLRPPANPVEEAELRFHAGAITHAEYSDFALAYAGRPADADMFEVYYRELLNRVRSLAGVLDHAITGGATHPDGLRPIWGDGDARTHLAAARATTRLFSAEVETADRFVQEARVDQGLPPIAAGEVAAACVGALVGRIVEIADRYLRPGGAHSRDRSAHFHEFWRSGGIPMPPALEVLLCEEHAAVRILLRKRGDEAKARTQTEGPLSGTAVSRGPVPSAKRVAIARWPDLRIGVDDNSILAFAPPPSIGDPVLLGRGVTIGLSGERWRILCELACRSANGRTVSQLELVRRCRPFDRPRDVPDPPPKPRRAGTPRTIQPSDAPYLTTMLSQFRRELEDQIEGPPPRHTSIFIRNGDTVDLGFVIQALFPTARGTTRTVPSGKTCEMLAANIGQPPVSPACLADSSSRGHIGSCGHFPR